MELVGGGLVKVRIGVRIDRYGLLDRHESMGVGR